MKRYMKLMVAITLVVCMLVGMAGCSSEKLAAKVGDKKITVTQIRNSFNNNSSYAAYYGFDVNSKEGRQEFLEFLLEGIMSNAAEAYQAEKAGIQLTDEEKAEVKKAAEEAYDNFIQEYVDYAKQAGSSDPEVYANKILAESLAKNGTTLAKVKDGFLQDETDKLLIQKHKDQIMESVEPTEENIKELYDAELASQQEAIAEDPSYYFTCENYFGYGYTYPGLVRPDGLFYVKHILVEDEETAKEVEEKIKAGEDFDALIKEYNTDPGMDADSEGYICGEGASFVEEFLNAALALENEGDVSPITKTEYGYHIIKRLGNVEAGVIPYEEVKDKFESMAKENYLTDYYNKIVEGWLKEDTEKYPENYLSIAD